jgi:hypothetical protein
LRNIVPDGGAFGVPDFERAGIPLALPLRVLPLVFLGMSTSFSSFDW